MSKAREIAEERLAKGEITEEEFENLIKKLSEPEKSTEIQKPKYLRYALFGAGVVIVILFFSSLKQDKVHILNLKSSGFLGDTVSGQIFTEGSSGYVWLWVEMNNNMMCPKKTYIQSKSKQSFNFTCRAMETTGRFKVLTDRYPPDWVKKNATSL